MWILHIIVEMLKNSIVIYKISVRDWTHLFGKCRFFQSLRNGEQLDYWWNMRMCFPTKKNMRSYVPRTHTGTLYTMSCLSMYMYYADEFIYHRCVSLVSIMVHVTSFTCMQFCINKESTIM